MKPGMSIRDLLLEVERRANAKRDYVASTTQAIRMVEMPDFPHGVALVLRKEGADIMDTIERFEITETCHRQIAGRLQIPWKYYFRLLSDHRDLVLHQVNALFEREPQTRLIRTIDGRARAFLSDKYRPMDNDLVLSQILPPLLDIDSHLLSSYVSDDRMYLKVLFTDDSLKMDIGETPRGRYGVDPQPHPWWENDTDLRNGRDIARPGIIISNSETGLGRLSAQGFFWRAYCNNGCVFGMDSIFEFSRRHVGAKLVGNGNFELFTDETKRKQDELIVAELTDSLSALTNRENVQKMADCLRAAKHGAKVENVVAAVDALAKEVTLNENEKSAVLTNLIYDGDLSRWGMLNAVTKVANRDDVTYERACELEQIGGWLASQITEGQWKRIATAEPVKVSA